MKPARLGSLAALGLLALCACASSPSPSFALAQDPDPERPASEVPS